MEELISFIEDSFNNYSKNYSEDSFYQEHISELRLFAIQKMKFKENSIKEYFLNSDKQYVVHKLKSSSALLSCYVKIYNNGDVRVNIMNHHKFENLSPDRFLRNIFGSSLGYVYFIYSEYGWKIGKAKHLNTRMRTFDVKLPFEWQLKHYIKSLNYHELEKRFHQMFEDTKINGEWFALNESDFEIIKKVAEVDKSKFSTVNKETILR